MIRGRLHWIDWSKCILIYLVVVAHYGQIPTFADNLICAFHMPAFFMISGYLHKVLSLRESISKNFKRLIIPALLFSILCWGFNLLRMALKDMPFSVEEYIYKPLLGLVCYDRPRVSPPCGVIWFLQVLFLSKLLLDIVVRKGTKASVAMCVFCISATAIWYSMGIDDKRYIFFIQRTCASFPFVILGYWAKEYQWFQKLSLSKVLPWLLLLLFVVGGLYHGRTGIVTWSFGHHALWFYLIALLGCFSFFLLVNKHDCDAFLFV